MPVPVKQRAVVSDERRKTVIEMVFNQGIECKQVAAMLNMKKRTVYGICQVFEKENRIERKPKTGRKVVFESGCEDAIVEFFERDNGASLKECRAYAEKNPEVFGERVPSIATIERILKKRKITTKNLYPVPKARNSPAVILRRFEYITELLRLENEGWTFVYVDEFGCNLHTSRKRGRNAIGRMAIRATPNQRGKNLSTCAAISDREGVVHYRSKFCSYNNVEFVSFLNEMFEKLVSPHKVMIVMDNASFHHHASVVNWFDEHRSDGIDCLYLPPYSPMLNPIEECFSKIHKFICTFKCSTSSPLLQAVSCAFSTVSISDCLGWYRHSRAYHTQCIRKAPIMKEADPFCPSFRVLDDDEVDSEDEIAVPN